MEKKKDGFPNEKAIVIPQEILLKVQKNPMTSLLYPTDIGYYPHAENHYRQREGGSEQHILIYCHEGEGWYDIGKGRCFIKKNQFFIIEAVGHWESSQVPYRLNQLVNFGRGTFVALQETSEPPLPIARFKDGTYMRKKDGGYILAGRSADMTVNPSWRMMSWNDESETLYWLDCPISAFSYTSTGSPSPSSVEVTCKMSRGGSVSDCVTLWLAARRYNGSWVAHVGATQSSKIAVPATAGYTQFVVRAYKSSSDASAWNSNYVAERGIGVAQAGKDGTDYEYIFQ